MDVCKIHSKYFLHTMLEIINFWCSSHSRWPTHSHCSFSYIL